MIESIYMRFIALLFLFSSIGVVFLQMHGFSLETKDTSGHLDALPLPQVSLPEKECVQKYKIEHTDTGIYYDPSTQRAFPSSGCQETEGGLIKLVDLHEVEGLQVIGSFASKDHLFVEYVIRDEGLKKKRFLYDFENKSVQVLTLPQDYYFSAFGINKDGDVLLLNRHLCLGCGRVNYYISVLDLAGDQYTALGVARFGKWSSNSSIIYYPMVEKDTACNPLGEDGCFEVQKYKPIIWDRNSGGKNANIVTTAI
jgi:hypothetical protein